MTVTGDDDVPLPTMISDHPAHHRGHRLKQVANDGPFFVCDGCMEPGAGARYRCEQEGCNFDLHTCCAVAPDTMAHPIIGDDRVFVFLLEPPKPTSAGATKGGVKFRVCVACGEDVRGFVYHCFDDGDDGIDFHPSCARLPEHAILNGSFGKQASSRTHDMSEDDDIIKGSRDIHCSAAAAHHRRWAGAGTGRQANHPRTENAQPEVRVFELRQETSRRPDMSNDSNRALERRAPAARHRWRK